MSIAQLKALYGDEYPSAVTVHGIRMPLSRETRFSRSYYNEEHRHGTEVSRFSDGSAGITLAEIEKEWPTWSDSERTNLCDACAWMSPQSDLRDILRFVMRHGNPKLWTLVVFAVAQHLPRDEAFGLLQDALQKANGNHTANITQAIAVTKHPDAAKVLREHLEALWRDPKLWDDDPFTNWVAFDATCCIAHLLQLGASSPEFQEQVRLLSAHPCEGNRSSCSTFLHEHYDWLPAPKPPQFGA